MTPHWFREVTADGWLLLAACAVRNLAYGYLSVILGLYLTALGLDVTTVGAIFTVTLGGGAALTLGLAGVADRVGRRRVLLIGSLLMVVSGIVFVLTDHVWLLTLAAVIGTMSPSGKDVGPFLSVEQAILPETAPAARRTELFAAYNAVNYGAAALGALGTAAPAFLGVSPQDGFRVLLWGYAGIGLVLAALFGRLSPSVEAPTRESAPLLRVPGTRRSRGTVAKLAALFALDSFAGGFIVQSLVALWFSIRFGADPSDLAAIFFGANLLAGLSFFAAPPLARRFGLLNTMVFTHLPSNVLLLLLPLMPTYELAIVVFLARFLLSQLDVPTRQSYTMAIIDPADRAAAAGVLAVTRNAAAAVAPALAGASLASPVIGLPFLVAGGLKIIYDLAIFAVFRRVRPPEEALRSR